METPPKRNILFCQLFKIKKQKFSRISESNEYKKIFFYKMWFEPIFLSGSLAVFKNRGEAA